MPSISQVKISLPRWILPRLVICLHGAAVGACLAQENLITNGDFSGAVTASGDSECPAGWSCSPALGVKRLKGSDGRPYLRMEAKTPPSGGAYVTQAIAYQAPDGKPSDYALTCDAKYEDCVPGPQGYMRARVLVLYTTSDRVLRDMDYAKYFKGTADWQKVTSPALSHPT